MDILQLKAAQRAADEKNNKAGERYVMASRLIKCTRCGHVPRKADTFFYKQNTGSSLYAAQADRICICKSCCEELYTEYADPKNPYPGLMRFCCDLNYYYDEDLARSLYDNCTFTIGSYIGAVNRTRKNLTFIDCVEKVAQKIAEEMQLKQNQKNNTQTIADFDRTAKWSIEDRKNKDNLVNLIGYDPYATDGDYTDDQLKFLYNTSANYITDAVEQDPHKLQNVILMVKTFLQINNIDKLITAEMNTSSPDTALMTSLTAMKEKLASTATRIANENGFSEKTSGKARQGTNTLSEHMKVMLQDGFTLAQVNIHDIMIAESFKEIANMNAQALINEMNLTGDDYARLCAEQRTYVVKVQNERDDLAEENRLLNIKVKDLETQIKQLQKQGVK